MGSNDTALRHKNTSLRHNTATLRHQVPAVLRHKRL